MANSVDPEQTLSFAVFELRLHCFLSPVSAEPNIGSVREASRLAPPTSDHKDLEVQDSNPALLTKTYLYNFYPLKPHFYIVKLGFTGVYIIFLISAHKIMGTR